MRIHVKAAILSTFVLPGLGQLHKGDRIKGIILIILTNVFLLAALFLVLRGLGPVILAATTAGPLAATQLLDSLRQNSPAARWLLDAFVVLWLASAIDAALAPAPLPRDSSKKQ